MAILNNLVKVPCRKSELLWTLRTQQHPICKLKRKEGRKEGKKRGEKGGRKERRKERKEEGQEGGKGTKTKRRGAEGRDGLLCDFEVCEAQKKHLTFP